MTFALIIEGGEDPCGGEQHGHAQERVGTSSRALRTAELARPRSQSTRARTATASSAEQHTQPGQQTIPASCRNPASRHSRCSAQARASGLAGAERAKTHSRSTRTTPRNLAASRGEAADHHEQSSGNSADVLLSHGPEYHVYPGRISLACSWWSRTRRQSRSHFTYRYVVPCALVGKIVILRGWCGSHERFEVRCPLYSAEYLPVSLISGN